MRFDYSEEQRLLADSVRRFVAQDYGFETRKKIVASAAGSSPKVWSKLAELGLLGLPFAEDVGGFGGGAVDLMGAMEAFGDALLVEPYLDTVALGGQFVARAGTAEQRARILPAVVEGRMKMAFAWAEPGSRYDLGHVQARATRSDAGYVLDGDKVAVSGAPQADEIVVSARIDDRIGLFLVEPPAMNARRALDETAVADLTLRAMPAARLGDGGDALALIEEVVDFATALICAEAVGAIRYANDATLEYLKTRKQFGVPIGSFQALQHRMVDMEIGYEQARSMASLACVKVDVEKDPAERKRVVSAAKIKIADACRHVSQEAVQLHGGMGMTDELKVSHTFRRLTAIAAQFGDAEHHLARFAL